MAIGDKSGVRVAIVGDSSQLARELQKAETKIAGFGDNAKKSGDILRTALFGGVILIGAQKLVKAAGDLEQSIGGTAAVFEGAAGSVDKFAKSAAQVVGLSENAARTLTSRLGASLKGAGLSAEEAAKQSIFLTKTGADLAATLGGNTSDAVAALGSALRGEFDPLEQFGIALKASQISAKAVSMGLAESEASASAYAKGQATLALITEKSAFALGQMGREANTAQGQQQRAAASMEDTSAALGKSLLPVYVQIQKTITLVAEAFAMLPGPVQTGVIALTAVALVGPKIYSATTAAIGAIQAFPAALEKAALSAAGTQQALNGMQLTTGVAGQTAVAAAGGMSLLGPAVLAVGAAVVVGGLAYKNYKDEQAAVKKDIDALIPTFNKLTGAITANTQTSLAAQIFSKNQIDNLNKARITTSEFTDVIDDNRDALVKQGYVEDILRGAVVKGSDKYKERIQVIRDAGGSQNELIARLLETDAADMGLIETLYNSIDAYNQNKAKVEELNEQKGISTNKTKDQIASENNLTAANKESEDKIKDLIDATKELYEIRISNEEAEIATRKALVEYNESLRDGGLSADERRIKEIELEETLVTQAKAFSELVGIQKVNAKETYSAGEASLVQAIKLGQLADALDPNSPVRKNLKGLAYDLYVYSQQDNAVKLRVETDEAVAKIRAFLGLSKDAVVSFDELMAYSANYPDRKATGGPVDAGTPYIVGEKGPELFVPSGYGRIIDAFSTNKTLLNNAGGSMGGGGSNVTINVSVSPTADKAAIGQTIVEAISSYERRSGPGWRS
jgi:hypothetical protein